MTGDKDLASNAGKMACYNSISEKIDNYGTQIEFKNCKKGNIELFENSVVGNYHLKAGCIALNMGENIIEIDGNTIDLFDYTDMDYTDRVKDCTMGRRCLRTQE